MWIPLSSGIQTAVSTTVLEGCLLSLVSHDTSATDPQDVSFPFFTIVFFCLVPIVAWGHHISVCFLGSQFSSQNEIPVHFACLSSQGAQRWAAGFMAVTGAHWSHGDYPGCSRPTAPSNELFLLPCSSLLPLTPHPRFPFFFLYFLLFFSFSFLFTSSPFSSFHLPSSSSPSSFGICTVSRTVAVRQSRRWCALWVGHP